MYEVHVMVIVVVKKKRREKEEKESETSVQGEHVEYMYHLYANVSISDKYLLLSFMHIVVVVT